MNHAEWLEVGARVGDMWPSQTWPPETMASAYDLFANVPASAAIQAVDELVAVGREFVPAPGVVLSRALAIVVASTPALPTPDMTRELTPEERERASAIASALNGKQAQLVVATWLEFAAHARIGLAAGEKAEQAAARMLGCDGRCARVAGRCRQSGISSHAVAPWAVDCCAVGRSLFEQWRYAIDQLRVLVAPDRGVQQEAAL